MTFTEAFYQAEKVETIDRRRVVCGKLLCTHWLPFGAEVFHPETQSIDLPPSHVIEEHAWGFRLSLAGYRPFLFNGQSDGREVVYVRWLYCEELKKMFITGNGIALMENDQYQRFQKNKFQA
jgi:hypothetical protein